MNKNYIKSINITTKKYFKFFIFIVLMIGFNSKSYACACGCGIFNVATSNIIPSSQGGNAFLQYDYISQSRNWSKDKASSAHNHNLTIRTQTYTAGLKYMFSRKWGIETRLPLVDRYVEITNHGATHGSPNYTTSVRNTSLGDVSLRGIYSGFSDDMSTGLIFGVRLPTGQTNNKAFGSRSKQIGTGSTNSILGFYHTGNINKFDSLNYFTQFIWEKPLVIHRGYHPGQEISGSLGVVKSFSGFNQIKKISPMVQIIGTKKQQDSGYNDPAHNGNSGYVFGYFAPGIELSLENFKIYTDIQLPFYRNVNKTQIVPQNLYKLILSYNF
jgi:hypothetical protein